jgi:hypothetical protein
MDDPLPPAGMSGVTGVLKEGAGFVGHVGGGPVPGEWPLEPHTPATALAFSKILISHAEFGAS